MRVRESTDSMADAQINDWKADILLVDDKPSNLAALQAVLEPLGQNLMLARSGKEALRLGLEAQPGGRSSEESRNRE